ncbi:MAG: PLP-dependent aminotransferase family protein [Nitriliruptoraceae bacterium]|nr:PLP-dependent aminotransferase family protein [Nitriliruptoraceae bacterium]
MTSAGVTPPDAAGSEPTGLLLELSLADVERGARAATLMDRLRASVRTGSLPAGTRLPPSRVLAADLGISRGVVVRAYEQLTAEGYLHAVQGRGTEVAAVRSAAVPTAERTAYPTTNPGLPSGAMFPREAWIRSLAQAVRDLPDAAYGYAHPAGLHALRVELSSYLGRVRAMIAPADRIVVTNGFGQTSRLAADVLTSQGIHEIGVEDPGSIGLREQLERSGLRCRPVPVDAHGLCVERLGELDVRAVVVTPAHQFPTGVVLSAERRHALVDWAHEHGGLIVEDDYDAEFRYDRSPVGALQGLAPERVLYGGSVSKTLAPGLRLGWMVVPEHLVDAFVDAKYAADLATNVVDQAALAHFIGTGQLDRHIRRAANTYRARRDRLVATLREVLPDWRVEGTAAGLHALVHPGAEQEGEASLAALASSCGLDAPPLGGYRVRHDPPGGAGLVIGYAHQRADSLARAIQRLAEVLVVRGLR